MCSFTPPDAPRLARWFAEEIQPHDHALRGWLRNQFRELRDHDDLIQECYLRVCRVFSEKPIRCGRAYVFAISRNLALNRLRAQRERYALGEPDLDTVYDEKADIRSRVVHDQDLALLHEALAVLPAKGRELFMLRRLHGVSQKDLAQRFGITEKTVEAHLFTAMKRVVAFFESREKQQPVSVRVPNAVKLELGPLMPHA
ncbi:MAG: hypothetical protein RL091_3276 [Verrucomicrobiota bacterium]|jgi:RNA polymerase sigma-70 factor (ECF subfamily)